MKQRASSAERHIRGKLSNVGHRVAGERGKRIPGEVPDLGRCDVRLCLLSRRPTQEQECLATCQLRHCVGTHRQHPCECRHAGAVWSMVVAVRLAVQGVHGRDIKRSNSTASVAELTRPQAGAGAELQHAMRFSILRQRVQSVVAWHSVGIEAPERGDKRRKVDGGQHRVAASCQCLEISRPLNHKAPELCCHAAVHGGGRQTKIARRAPKTGTPSPVALRMNGASGCLLACTQAAPPGVSPSSARSVVPLSVLDNAAPSQPPDAQRRVALLSVRLPYACLCSVAAE